MEQIINPAQQVHGEEEINAAIEVIKSGEWAYGEYVEKFEASLAEYLGRRFALTVNSGSSANLVALMALTTHWIPEERRIMPGDEIITSALCFPTTVSPIKYARGVPVFVDVDHTWNIDPEQVKSVINENTKAIMVAHNLGSPFDIDAIREICEENGLWLITDNCDALGSEWDGQQAGSYGHIGTQSFYPAHHISTGEGGAVHTDNPRIMHAMRSMINWGRDCWCPPGHDNTCGIRYDQQHGGLPHGYDHKNTYSELGFNVKMTNIQGALGYEQMKRLPEFTNLRRLNHTWLSNLFMSFGDNFEIPKVHEKADPSWFGYVVKINNPQLDRDDMVRYLEERGIRSRAFFCGNITKQPCFYGRDDVAYRTSEDLSVSDDLMETSFWIGCHPGITDDQREYMAQVITSYIEQHV
jgi:CDP-6-deoxy-D-xylo-4-hexulose-3-dehydrase